MTDNLLTQRQVSLLLGVSIRTVKRLRLSGELPTIRLTNRTIRIPASSAQFYIQRRRWQKDFPLDLNQTPAATITPSIRKVAAAAERVYGLKIYLEQNIDLRDG